MDGWITTAPQVGRLPWLEQLVYQDPAEVSPVPVLKTTGPHENGSRGIWWVCIFSGPTSGCISKDREPLDSGLCCGLSCHLLSAGAGQRHCTKWGMNVHQNAYKGLYLSRFLVWGRLVLYL